MSEPSLSVMEFRGRSLPEPAKPVGYAALINQYGLSIPLPRQLAAIAERHKPRSTVYWHLLSPRHEPENTLFGHLEFAIKWEGIDLGVLAALFKAVTDKDVIEIIRSAPTSSYTRRIWYLYEWVTGRQLDVPGPGKVRAVQVVDPTKQFAIEGGTQSPRHKIIDNLPGTPAFCPLVGRTQTLDNYIRKNLNEHAREIVGRTHADVVRRAAAFLLLSDSKASFQIEGEEPSTQRMERWGRIIGQAGSQPLTIAELERLQKIVIGDARFVRLGLRNEGGFVGMHDRTTQEPMPDHISARPQDLRSLVEGIINYEGRATEGKLDPVIAAASAAFGFVYVHPFEDGNGRLHRWLIHHVLARSGYNLPNMVFPISAVMLRETEKYRQVLESYSKPLLELIDWEPTSDGNVNVRNDTANYYRYFDATSHAEFMYDCVEQTVKVDLPEEIAYLGAYDEFGHALQEIVDMPSRKTDLLYKFLTQSNGRLSERAKTKEFSSLTAEEIRRIENLYSRTTDRFRAGLRTSEL
jgi:Fic family protein